MDSRRYERAIHESTAYLFLSDVNALVTCTYSCITHGRSAAVLV